MHLDQMTRWHGIDNAVTKITAWNGKKEREATGSYGIDLSRDSPAGLDVLFAKP